MNDRKMTPETQNLIAFCFTVAAIVVLSKFGANPVDLAVMTALVAVAGTLANNFRKSQPVSSVEKADTVNQNNSTTEGVE